MSLSTLPTTNQINMNQKEYFVVYTPEFTEFLRSKNVKHFTSEADITSIVLEGYNDSMFFMLVLEFAEWLIENENDMTINPNAKGGQYHRCN